MDKEAEAQQEDESATMLDQVERVAGIIVTYHPGLEVVHHLATLRPQVGRLIVVDNGSDASAVTMLQEASSRIGFDLVTNGENLGIATALNIGCRTAIDRGCDWLLLFDQDSCITGEFTSAMLATFAALSHKRIGILVPHYIDSRTGHPLPPVRLADGTLATAMTSGSLISVPTYQACGPFADELFIDSVDHEYSLRVRKTGYIIAVCENARLLHSPGTPRPHTLLGLIKFQSTNYTPVRRYYQERNKLWMYRRYGLRFPAFCAREFLRSLVDLAKILLVESDKQQKCRFYFRGIYDGLRGRMGKL
jgi:rhamnosyltransferase